MTSRMRDGTSVRKHGVRMIGLVEKLSGLDITLPHELSVDVLLLSLPAAFNPFVSTST
ncbi:Retrotransposon protein [Dorcoceras hygrometricum]|uniref:Retrotransposon protein n=1 Tax=Dorcoceras hygrometricum TaxID=472368 RepID=A0A2Z6ZQS4_9LAMI|nr:Retrotransposon protein [Dorcoceras hygrometricum]